MDILTVKTFYSDSKPSLVTRADIVVQHSPILPSCDKIFPDLTCFHSTSMVFTGFKRCHIVLHHAQELSTSSLVDVDHLGI